MRLNGSQQHYSIHGNEIGLASVNHFGVNIFPQADPLGWHRHEGSLEFVFICEGSATYELNDQYQLNLHGGEFSYLPPGMLHRALENPKARTSNDYVRAAVNYMQEHLTEPLEVTDVAVYLDISTSRLYAMFKESTGLTPNDYLLRLRVSRAKKLIAETGDSLSAIAEKTGLGSSQYLCRVFRKYTGHRPSHYRNT